MQKKISNSDHFWIKEERSFQPTEPTKSWCSTIFQKIKNLFGVKKKNIQLPNTHHSSKIIAFTQPTYQIEIKSISINSVFEPSIHFVLLTKETCRIHVYLRNASKKIIHHSSHLILQGERDFSIILKNDALFENEFFIQIKEASGKTQSRRFQF